jgi:hypothetical protein
MQIQRVPQLERFLGEPTTEQQALLGGFIGENIKIDLGHRTSLP